MKRSLILSLAILLAAGSTAPARSITTGNDEQEVAMRERRATFPGFLGVELDEVSREAAQRLSLREERGALVSSVISESSAARAGLQKDDVIVKWNGERVESAMEVSRHLRETPSGRTIRLGVIRGGREMDVDVTLGERSDYLRRFQAEREKERAARLAEREKERAARAVERQKEMAEREKQRAQAMVEREKERQQQKIEREKQRAEHEKERAARMVERQREMAQRAAERMSVVRFGGRSRLGIQLQSMSPQLAEYFGLSNRNGALVVFVHADSPAAKAGLKAGDVVLSIGGEKVEGPGEVSRVLRTKSEGPVEVRVMRDRREQSFTVQLEKAESGTWLLDDPVELIAPVPVIVTAMPTLALKVPSIAISPVRVALPALAPIPHVVIPKIVTPAPKISVPKITLPPVLVPMKLRIPSRYV